MSYCRFGNPDSEVYAFVGGAYWHVNVSYQAKNPDLAGKSYLCNDIYDFQDRLIWLVAHLVKVPERVFERINEDIKHLEKPEPMDAGRCEIAVGDRVAYCEVGYSGLKMGHITKITPKGATIQPEDEDDKKISRMANQFARTFPTGSKE
jgi:hypothetical protein